MVDAGESARQSRATLSKANSVPEWLLAKYALPPDTVVHHTVHKDATLPLFQGKLCGGQIYDGKSLRF